MEMSISKFSYCSEIAGIPESIGMFVDGRYTHVYFGEKPKVQMNYPTKHNHGNRRTIRGKKAQAIIEFALAHIDEAKP